MDNMSNSNKMSNNFNGRVYKALMILIFGVVLLFLMEGRNMLRSDQCYPEVGYFDVIHTKSGDKSFIIHPTSMKKMQDDNTYVKATERPYTTQLIQDEENIDNQLIRQQRLRDFCRDKYKKKSTVGKEKFKFSNIFYSDRQGVLYCYVPKVACTNWKRVFLVFQGKSQHPLDVSRKEDVHKIIYPNLGSINKEARDWRRNVYYSFMFVRHPFERLLSAYRNKLQDPYNTMYQTKYGSQILKLFRENLTRAEYGAGQNVTFEEFTKYIIRTYEKSGTRELNEHWQVMHSLCSPCTIKYNFIGKMNSLISDAGEVLQQIGVDKDIKFPANATDKYQVKTDEMLKTYYGKLSKETINKLYDIYEDDFVAFGYSVEDYL